MVMKLSCTVGVFVIRQDYEPKSNTQDFSAINLCGHEVTEVMSLVEMRSLGLVLIQSDLSVSQKGNFGHKDPHTRGRQYRQTKGRKPFASQEVEPGIDLS